MASHCWRWGGSREENEIARRKSLEGEVWWRDSGSQHAAKPAFSQLYDMINVVLPFCMKCVAHMLPINV